MKTAATRQPGKQKTHTRVVEHEGFNSAELGEQAVYDDETEIARRIRRGDESKGDPDERDIAGAPHSEEVSHEISSDKDWDD